MVKPQLGIFQVLFQALLADYLEFSCPVSQIGKLRPWRARDTSPVAQMDGDYFCYYDRKLDSYGVFGHCLPWFPPPIK